MRFKFFLFSLFVAIATCAQNQRGVVRTIGTSSHHGVPVAGATIKVKGNSQQYLSDNKGAFSLSMHSANAGDKFQLLNVTKRGYELADKDFLSKTFAYSSQSLLEIVLLSTEEMEKEKQAIEDRVFKIAKDNYEKKRDGLKHEQEQGLITIEDYRAKLKTLQDQYDTFDEILSAMAEHYARTDYDRLDSLDVLINTHIINGELDEADMLVAQKGNLDDRIAAYQRHAATNAAAREMLDKLTDELRGQRLAYEKERDDIANDLYNKHSIAISRFDFDQALEMLKLRADLDTTNMEAVWDYATLCYKQKKFEDCEKYYLIALNVYVTTDDVKDKMRLLINLGTLYYDIHNYKKAEILFLQALQITDSVAIEEDETFLAQKANALHNLGSMYTQTRDLINGEKYLSLSVEIRERLVASKPETYRHDLMTSQQSLGILYTYSSDFQNAEKYFISSLRNLEELFLHDAEQYRGQMAVALNNLGSFYNKLRDYVNSEKYYLEATEHREILFSKNPDAYRASLAMTQNNLGSMYASSKQYESAEKYLLKSLENREYLFAQQPEAYRYDLANTQNNLGYLYNALHDYANCEKFYLLAIENKETLFAKNPNVYRASLVNTEMNLGLLYRDIKDYNNSEKYFKRALENFEKLHSQNERAFQNGLVNVLKNLTMLYIEVCRYSDAMTIVARAIDLVPSSVEFYDSKGEILLMQGRNDEALEMWKKVLEVDPNFLDNYPDGTNLSNGLKKLGLIE